MHAVDLPMSMQVHAARTPGAAVAGALGGPVTVGTAQSDGTDDWVNIPVQRLCIARATALCGGRPRLDREGGRWSCVRGWVVTPCPGRRRPRDGDAHNYRTPTKPHKNHNKTPNRKPASETAGNCGNTDTDVGNAVHEFAGVRKLLLQSVTMTGDSLTRLRQRRLQEDNGNTQ